jgi:hypothetical protein
MMKESNRSIQMLWRRSLHCCTLYMHDLLLQQDLVPVMVLQHKSSWWLQQPTTNWREADGGVRTEALVPVKMETDRIHMKLDLDNTFYHISRMRIWTTLLEYEYKTDVSNSEMIRIFTRFGRQHLTIFFIDNL